jgi:hypothetical protein
MGVIMDVTQFEIEKKDNLYRWYTRILIADRTITKHSDYCFDSEKSAVDEAVQMLIKLDEMYHSPSRLRLVNNLSNPISDKFDVPLNVVKRMLVLGKDRNLGVVIENIKEYANYGVRRCDDGVTWVVERMGSEQVIINPSKKYNAELLARRIALIMNSDNHMGGSNESM